MSVREKRLNLVIIREMCVRNLHPSPRTRVNVGE